MPDRQTKLIAAARRVHETLAFLYNRRSIMSMPIDAMNKLHNSCLCLNNLKAAIEAIEKPLPNHGDRRLRQEVFTGPRPWIPTYEASAPRRKAKADRRGEAVDRRRRETRVRLPDNIERRCSPDPESMNEQRQYNVRRFASSERRESDRQ